MNEYFLPGSVPATNAPGSSATIRSEFASVAAAFDKLPTMAGNADEFVVINPTGTSLISSGLIATDLVTLTGVQSLTNKTLSWAGNTWVGFGTAATKDAGTGPGQVLLLTEDNKLPTMDGSNLTNLNPAQLGVVDIANGGTGASTLGAAQTALGIDLKADANNTVLTGAPVCPTPADGDNSAKIANTFFVNQAVALVGGLTPSNSTPLMDAVGAPGVAAQASRGDHVHPSDTTKAPLASPAFTGNPTAPTPAPGDNDTSIATTAFVTAAVAAGGGVTLSDANPVMDGVATPGVSTDASRADHVHATDTSRAPTSAGTAAGTSFTPAGAIAATNVQAALTELDTEKAPLASPVFTGNPTAPTPATVDNDTSIATTAFVQAVIAAQPAGMSPSNDVPLINGTAAAGTSVTGSRSDHVHPTDTSRAAAATLTAHTGNTSNPHSVTAAQVGLGSVDNTSDTTKNAAVATLTNKTLDAANCKLGAITGLLKAAAGAFSAATAGTDYVAPGGALGTPSSGTLTNCTFPTFNQNTTGSAASVSGTTTAAIAASALGSGTADTNTYLRGDRTWQAVGAGTPAGVLAPFAGTIEPAGWLLCYGQAVSRATYATLFAAISTVYGVGDGSTTFNLPDLRGRVVGGKDNMGGTAASRLTSPVAGSTLGAVGGTQSHTLTTTEMPAHTHTITSGNTGGVPYIGPYGVAEMAGTQTGSAGSGGAHNNTQPTIVLNYIIKT